MAAQKWQPQYNDIPGTENRDWEGNTCTTHPKAASVRFLISTACSTVPSVHRMFMEQSTKLHVTITSYMRAIRKRSKHHQSSLPHIRDRQLSSTITHLFSIINCNNEHWNCLLSVTGTHWYRVIITLYLNSKQDILCTKLDTFFPVLSRWPWKNLLRVGCYIPGKWLLQRKNWGVNVATTSSRHSSIDMNTIINSMIAWLHDWRNKGC